MNFFEFKKRLLFLYSDLVLRIFVMFTGTICLITDIGNYPVVSLFINISTFTYYKTLLGVYPVFYMGVLFSNTEDYNVNTAPTTAPADELSLILFTAEDFRYIVKLKTIEASSSISFYINLYSHMSAKLNYEYATTLSKINYQIQRTSLIADVQSLETLTVSYLKYMLQHESFLDMTTAALVELSNINLHPSHTFSLGLTESILYAFSLEIKGSHDYTTDITVYPTDSYYVKLDCTIVFDPIITQYLMDAYSVKLSQVVNYLFSPRMIPALNVLHKFSAVTSFVLNIPDKIPLPTYAKFSSECTFSVGFIHGVIIPVETILMYAGSTFTTDLAIYDTQALGSIFADETYFTCDLILLRAHYPEMYFNGVSYSSITLQDLSVYIVDLAVTIAYNYSVDILLATNKYLNDYEFKYIGAIEDNTLIKETYKEV